MDSTVSGRTSEGNEDALKAWLDGCYRMWNRANHWMVFALLFLVWLPAVYFLAFQFFQEQLVSQFGIAARIFRFQMMGYSPAACFLIAILVASASTGSFVFESNVRLSSPKLLLFRILRDAVRIKAYKWMIALILIPNYAVILIYSARFIRGEWVFLSSIDQHIESLLFWLLMLTMICFTGAELVQFITLRFSSTARMPQIAALLAFGCLFAVLWIWLPLEENIPRDPRWFYLTTKLLVRYGPPVLVALFMMLATRKPTPAMLERL